MNPDSVITFQDIFTKEKYNYLKEYFLYTNGHDFWELHNSGEPEKNRFGAFFSASIFYNNEDQITMELTDLFIEKLTDFENLLGVEFYIERIYANCQALGQPGTFHEDYSDEDGRTLLIYLTDWDYDVNYHGYTEILQENGSVKSLPPYPNTAIYFKGNRPHRGMPLLDMSKDPRISIAYKLRLKEGHCDGMG